MNQTWASVRRWLPIAVTVVIVDQLTKRWALSALADGRVIELIGPSRLRLSFNTGIAFGQGQGRGLGPLIAAIGLIVVVGLVTSIGRRSGQLAQYAVGLIVGGAVGNIIDRLTQPPGWLRGGVVDFIQAVGWFPIFNLADVAITIGGFGLVLAMMRQQRLDAAASEGPVDARPADSSPTGEASHSGNA